MPIYSSSVVPISKIDNQGVVKIIRISDSPTDPYAEIIEKFYFEEAEVVNPFSDPLSSTSTTQPPAKKFHSQVIPSTPRKFQPFLSNVPCSIPPPSPNSLNARPAISSAVRQSPIPQPSQSPFLNFQQLQHLTSTSRRREYQSPFPVTVYQVLQGRENFPSGIPPSVVNEVQDTVAMSLRRVDRNSMEVIMYANNRMIDHKKAIPIVGVASPTQFQPAFNLGINLGSNVEIFFQIFSATGLVINNLSPGIQKMMDFS
ncbi:hypothetical protein O181_117507 [Austropuccinia psidii MF-1]|uniref:Uncharacterized protein n=1 Tax=Austropuccinia psidii MF-1 TaxID=1389203 RepID=A0A9Q3PZH5_9BASI|nr:hypothetical protein [Austropuccinia psidii MF-1]